ncbi:Multi-copper oxidase [Mycena venus]|uniref:Multi-copper oxidase n=1 Tax=Mycena venus TaxID=2733690 RepID=A0A8H6YJG7_9AGAR|nr:Multi-copper oxidase [Mycena venus]
MQDMQDADTDEQELFITRPDSRLDADSWARGPSRRTSEPIHSDSESTSLSVSPSAAFRLNPSFAVTVGLMMRSRLQMTVRITRLPLIHAGTFAPLRVCIDRHAVTLVEADGARLAHDATAEKAKEEGKEDLEQEEGFWIRHESWRMSLRITTRIYTPKRARSCDTPPRLQPRSTQDEIDAWFALPQFNEWALRPSPSPSPPSSSDTDTKTLVLQIQNPRSQFPKTDIIALPFAFSIQRTHDLTWRSFINGMAWEVPAKGEAALVGHTARLFARMEKGEEGVWVRSEDQLIASLRHGRVVDFVIIDLDDGVTSLNPFLTSRHWSDLLLQLCAMRTDHPFHLHGYSVRAIGSSARGAAVLPTTANLYTSDSLRRNTFTVPARGWVVVRIVAYNAGCWAFHCHIAWHMLGSGLFQIAVPPANGQEVVLPEDIVQQCEIKPRSWSGS